MDSGGRDLLKNFDVSKKIDFNELTVDFSNPLVCDFFPPLDVFLLMIPVSFQISNSSPKRTTTTTTKITTG